jgi:hypothetical protein
MYEAEATELVQELKQKRLSRLISAALLLPRSRFFGLYCVFCATSFVAFRMNWATSFGWDTSDA